MFDYHMHSTVSFDAHGKPQDMVSAAIRAGLQEICFTDHIDYLPGADLQPMVFDPAAYRAAYDQLSAPGLLIRRGVEFGITPDNPAQLRQELTRYPYDFVLGSIHLVDGVDVYPAEYWMQKDVELVYRRYLEEILAAVRVHEDYDVLGHLTYISKCRGNPTHAPVRYEDHQQIIDEILTILVRKGKGLEVNTSGVDSCGVMLPDETILRRFRELGGTIVTIGSDAHTPDRVGQYTRDAARLVGDIFGHICTFAQRKPIFHKL